jgi:NADH:ubiquinone oxidoreductase subunit 6 (subunit J)
MNPEGYNGPAGSAWPGIFAIVFYIGLITVTGVTAAMMLQKLREKEQEKGK